MENDLLSLPHWPDRTEIRQNANLLILRFYDHHIAGPLLLLGIYALTGSMEKFHAGVSEDGIFTVVVEVNDLLPEFITEGE